MTSKKQRESNRWRWEHRDELVYSLADEEVTDILNDTYAQIDEAEAEVRLLGMLVDQLSHAWASTSDKLRDLKNGNPL